MTARCWFGHRWEEHPEFAGGMFTVRRCQRCGRVEHRTLSGYWLRKKHLETPQ